MKGSIIHKILIELFFEPKIFEKINSQIFSTYLKIEFSFYPVGNMILLWPEDGGFSFPHLHLSLLLSSGKHLISWVLSLAGCLLIQNRDSSSFFFTKTPLIHSGFNWMLMFFKTTNSLELLINENSRHFGNTSFKQSNMIYDTMCVAIVYYEKKEVPCILYSIL